MATTKPKKYSAQELAALQKEVDSSLDNLAKREELCALPDMTNWCGSRGSYLLFAVGSSARNSGGVKQLISQQLPTTAHESETLHEVLSGLLAVDHGRLPDVLDFIKSL